MANDKDKSLESDPQQTTQSGKPKINPFKDPAPAEDPQQQIEQEIALEQQRKEALSERD